MIDHLNITVKNMEETKDWYHKLFGFEVVEEYMKERGTKKNKFTVLKSDESLLCVTEYPDLKPAHKNSSGEDFAFIYHFGLRIEDKKEWEQKVKDFNLKLYYGGPIKYPHSTSWYVHDPSGHEIEVVYWEKGEPRFS